MDTLCSECEVCSSDETDLFKCKSCLSPENENTVAILCQFCVLSHVRKKHDVTQFDGQEIIICGVHKIICTNYCRNCKLFLCVQCTIKHISDQHDIENIAKIAVECKKKIHSMLDELDVKYKEGAKLLKSVQDYFESKKSESKYTNANQVEEALVEMMLKVCHSSDVQARIRNSLQWVDELEKYCADDKEDLEKLGKQQVKLRSLLSKSCLELTQSIDSVSEEVSSSKDEGLSRRTVFLEASKGYVREFQEHIAKCEAHFELELNRAISGFLDGIGDRRFYPGRFQFQLEKITFYETVNHFKADNLILSATDSVMCIALVNGNEVNMLEEKFPKRSKYQWTSAEAYSACDPNYCCVVNADSNQILFRFKKEIYTILKRSGKGTWTYHALQVAPTRYWAFGVFNLDNEDVFVEYSSELDAITFSPPVFGPIKWTYPFQHVTVVEIWVQGYRFLLVATVDNDLKLTLKTFVISPEKVLQEISENAANLSNVFQEVDGLCFSLDKTGDSRLIAWSLPEKSFVSFETESSKFTLSMRRFLIEKDKFDVVTSIAFLRDYVYIVYDKKKVCKFLIPY